MSADADFLVLGGGIAGAACGAALARHGRVLLLEREQHFGYHATGRSAALFSEYFGNTAVRALTAASRGFFESPPEGFTEVPLLTPRGVIALATADDVAQGHFDAALHSGREAAVPPREIGLDEARRLCPVLAPREHVRALLRAAAMDIDADALQQAYLRQLRARGGKAVSGVAVNAIRREGGLWVVRTSNGTHAAPRIVNAAGAWADEVAAMAGVARIGLVPKRRTAVLVDVPPEATAERPLHDWPMVTDLADTFYFKPESGKLMACPCDETPSAPTDAQPEELDVAIAVARLEEVTTLSVRRVTHKWAGLRSFVDDEVPVLGAAPDTEGFYWAAALGGYGLQTAPAVAEAVASLVTQGELPPQLAARGLTARMLSPARLLVRALAAASA
ncbi:MAG: FAD-binding oxidoreductase [Pseudomonadota bacterium]